MKTTGAAGVPWANRKPETVTVPADLMTVPGSSVSVRPAGTVTLPVCHTIPALGRTSAASIPPATYAALPRAQVAASIVTPDTRPQCAMFSRYSGQFVTRWNETSLNVNAPASLFT